MILYNRSFLKRMGSSLAQDPLEELGIDKIQDPQEGTERQDHDQDDRGQVQSFPAGRPGYFAQLANGFTHKLPERCPDALENIAF
jgi:hypothetical protein